MSKTNQSQRDGVKFHNITILIDFKNGNVDALKT